jgi:IS5 family transposase
VFENLLTGDENACYTDKAYASDNHEKLLDEKTVDNGILHKAKCNKPLTPEQKQQNKIWSGTGLTVERTLGILKLY